MAKDACYFLMYDNDFIQFSCIPADYHEMIFSFSPVRVKGGMSLRNEMWHDSWNGITMRNLIFAE